MSGNLSLLTVLFIMCYFVKKSRNVVRYTELTRDSSGDYFTNVCKNCYEYGATLNQGVCRCESPRSLFLRFEKHCEREAAFVSKYHTVVFTCEFDFKLFKAVYNKQLLDEVLWFPHYCINISISQHMQMQ